MTARKKIFNTGVEALIKEGRVTHEKKEIADNLIKQFESVFSNTDKNTQQDFPRRKTAILKSIYISADTIRELLAVSDSPSIIGLRLSSSVCG